MFQPEKYRKKESRYILDFIKAHPFATFVIKGQELLATHIPIMVKGNAKEFVPYGHIAKANEQYSYLKDGLEGLLIFSGAQGYVSSSWYREKDISTWDYSAVHINCKLKLQSKDELVDSLKNLVRHFESKQKNPLYFEDLPGEMIDDHLPLITGFWCEPIKIQAIAKLHQGFDQEDIHSITRHLDRKSDPFSKELSTNIKIEHDAGN